MAKPHASAREPDEGTLDDAARACPSCGQTFPADYLVCPRDGAPLGVAANDTDPLIGCVIGASYRIERAVARGGMGRLYAASHTRLPRKVAVKVLHEPHAQRREAVRRFEREASALSRIDHPNVLGVLDFVRTPDGRGAIVTPLLEGETLQARLEREPVLPERDALRIAREIARGLAAAHAEGIVHRDLKPSNIFLAQPHEHASAPTRTPHVKLLDFGVAKLADDDMTRTGVVLGTPAYMAPEQARGSADVDARADVYAVGAILYRMLAGVMPYEGSEASEVLAQLLARAPRALGARTAVRAEVAAVVDRAMAREPEERFATVGDLAAALDRASDDRPEGGRVSRPATQAKHALARERALAVGASLTITSLTVAAVLAIVHVVTHALDASSERALALAFALDVVAGAASGMAVAWSSARAVLDRRESAASLASLRDRLLHASIAGIATLGTVHVVVLALDRIDPWIDLLALFLASTAAVLSLARGRFLRRSAT